MVHIRKIEMKPGCRASKNAGDIEFLFVGGPIQSFVKMEEMQDDLKKHPGSMKAALPLYPDLLPAVSRYGEKYVRSQTGNSPYDLLLRLPRE